MQNPLNLLADPDRLCDLIVNEKNQVWKIFSRQFGSAAEEQLKEEKLEVTPENKEKRLKEFLENCDHPVHTYLHVFKCRRCPEYHKVETPCIVAFYDVQEEIEGKESEAAVMKNVTLAFPIDIGDNNYLYSLHTGIEELSMLGLKDNPRLILVDPTMKEIATSQDVTAH